VDACGSTLATTGAPLLFGYEALWGRDTSSGFTRHPGGVAHTPARGFELVSLYFFDCRTYLFETPVPSLVAATRVAAAWYLGCGASTVCCSAGSALLVRCISRTGTTGFYLGPRFYVCLLPALALWERARLSGMACALGAMAHPIGSPSRQHGECASSRSS
jgi:hypothetical protein